MSDFRKMQRLPISVWATGQQPAAAQRRERYVPASMAHPAKMLPAIAVQAINTYTTEGDLVIDPMCGIGTALVEAIHLRRDAYGVEYEHRWANLARANIAHARRQGATGQARIVCGDARHLAGFAGPSLKGRAALCLTSPPYGASLHGRVRSRGDSGRMGIAKWDNSYGDDPANLAHAGIAQLLQGFTEILAGCRELLRAGGIVAITTRPFRLNGELIDFPSHVLTAAEAAGLEPIDRLVALLAGLRDDKLIPRASFFQLLDVRKARTRGEPRYLIAHEDLLVLRNPDRSEARANANVDPVSSQAA